MIISKNEKEIRRFFNNFSLEIMRCSKQPEKKYLLFDKSERSY